MKELNVDEEFINLFSFISEKEKFTQRGSEYNLIHLPISNNEFFTSNVIDYLSTKLPEFIFSEKTCKEFSNDRIAYRDAKKKLISYSEIRKKVTLGENPTQDQINKYSPGEIGEILLFCFLEGHLNAPKILSKYEMKTSGQMPVHGSDGVHLLKNDNGTFELIFGESKMKKELTDASSEAIKSIDEFKTRAEDNIYSEVTMITSNLNKEVTPENEEFIKDLLIPQKKCNTTKRKDSFGLFLGFDLKRINLNKDETDDDYLKKLTDLLQNKGEKNREYIVKKIKEKNLLGHKFYVYVLPFEDLQKDRNILIERL